MYIGLQGVTELEQRAKGVCGEAVVDREAQ